MEHFLFFSIVSAAITLVSLIASSTPQTPPLVPSLQTDNALVQAQAQAQSVEESVDLQRDLTVPHLATTQRSSIVQRKVQAA